MDAQVLSPGNSGKVSLYHLEAGSLLLWWISDCLLSVFSFLERPTHLVQGHLLDSKWADLNANVI